jgi:hypothetical protein
MRIRGSLIGAKLVFALEKHSTKINNYLKNQRIGSFKPFPNIKQVLHHPFTAVQQLLNTATLSSLKGTADFITHPTLARSC